MHRVVRPLLNLSTIESAAKRVGQAAVPTPLEHNKRLSDLYDATILVKREDLQPVRSFKIRGAYNKISLLDKAAREKGVVCSSAGNHAQGVAYACSHHDIHGTIFMPSPTPQQKVSQVAMFGGDKVTIKLVGDTMTIVMRRPWNMLLKQEKYLSTRLMIQMLSQVRRPWHWKLLRRQQSP